MKAVLCSSPCRWPLGDRSGRTERSDAAPMSGGWRQKHPRARNQVEVAVIAVFGTRDALLGVVAFVRQLIPTPILN